MSRLLILLILLMVGCSEPPSTCDVEQVDLSAGVISLGDCGDADGTISVDDDKRILWH